MGQTKYSYFVIVTKSVITHKNGIQEPFCSGTN